MNKKLTPLETFKLFCRSYICDLNTLRHREIEEDYFYNPKYKVSLTDIKTGNKGYTADIEKSLKALELIKEKGVDVDCLIYNFKFGSLDDYNCDFTLYEEDNWRILTQEEFDLLKEVLL